MTSRRLLPSIAILLASAAAATGCHPSTNHPGSTGTNPTTAAEFFATYARLYCEGFLSCETAYSAYTQGECEAMILAEYGGGTIGDAIASGAVALDVDAAHACLELLAASPSCAADWSEEYCLEDGVIVGTTQAGGACDSDAQWLCAPGTRCSAVRFSGACGTCQAITRVGEGQPCTDTDECLQSASALLFCDFDDVDNRDECMRWTNPSVASLGQDCSGNVVCVPGTECDWSDTETCLAQIAIGQECIPHGDIGCLGSAPCVDDPGSSLGGTCRSRGVARAVGESCGLVGTTFVECLESANLACDTATSKCITSSGGTLGSPCGDVDCAPGLHCDYGALNPTCAADLADGAACTERDECASGFCFGEPNASVCGNAASVAVTCAP